MTAPPTQVTTIAVEAWRDAVPGLVHGFTGGMESGAAGLDANAVRALLGPAAPPVLQLEQPHGTQVLDARRAPSVQGASGGLARGFDGAFGAAARPVVICIRSADCIPVLALDDELGVYAALHAGWRGTAQGILPKLLATLRAQGSTLGRVRLALGPGIQACCFEVQADCIAAFDAGELAHALHRRAGRTFIDLAAVLRAQALRAGVDPARISDVALCTACHLDHTGEHPFASYRRSRRTGGDAGRRNVSFIGINASMAQNDPQNM
ncbi:MAG: polyphenol oxidase family protein [Candidatus Lambdaproteobacteria bacterium]|nr:polyphenol oxidase family protein [Candidatus Lambdaproteobacteria bacterium]